MNLLVRRRELWDYLGGALWVFPTVSVVGFLTAGALLSRVSVDADSPLWPLAFQGIAEDAREILVVVSATMITVTGLVFALTIVALQIAAVGTISIGVVLVLRTSSWSRPAAICPAGRTG